MKTTTIIVTSGAIVAAVAVGAYRLGRTRATPPVSPADATATGSRGTPSEGNAELVSAVERLDRRLGALELKQLYANAAGSQAAAAAPGTTGGPPDFAALKEKDAQRAALIEAAVNSQPRDRAWASATETALQSAADAAVKEGGAQFRVKTLRCFTSICEIVLSSSSAEQLGHGTALALLRRLGEVGSFDFAQPETAADGSATVTYRLFRKGYTRPDEGT